jgi:predicted anti-sigma-YlaC factor YlaD
VIRCEDARRLLDSRLDGEIGPVEDHELARHLDGCPSCRDVAAGLDLVSAELRNLAPAPLPDDAFLEVIERTVGSARRGEAERSAFRRVVPWVGLAAAAGLAAFGLLRVAGPPPSPEPSPLEVARARQEARAVLSLASGAVRTAESTARSRVLAGAVAPALRHLPFHRKSPL